MATINAYKMDGLGNDFIIIDRRSSPINLTKDKIIELGKRSNIGFDQIIFIEKEIENSFPIKIFNSDGIEVSACGNGVRCIAYLIYQEKKDKSIAIKTNERVDQIVKNTNFSNLQYFENLSGFEESTKYSKFFRKGHSGQWHKNLSNEQIKHIEKKLKYLMKNSKKHINKKLFEREKKERVIADFIAGMTDRYAVNLHKKIK